MKLSFPKLLMAFVTLIPAATGEYAVRTLLNHGYILPSGEQCTTAEWDKIESTIEVARRRNLRTDRNLATLFCQRVCQGFAPGHCYLAYSKCTGIRRLDADAGTAEQLPSTSGGKFRELETQTCSDRIADINHALDALEPSLSKDCGAVLHATRDFACYEVVECKINGFALWNADTDTVSAANFGNGDSFCKSASQINIEAVADTCVTKVQFKVTGPGGYSSSRTENTYRWMAYGNSGNDMYGQTLNIGTYSLTAYPDDDKSMAQSLTFTVKDC